MKYEGKFVFVQVKNPSKELSRYRDGEYFCFRETPNVLYCFKSGGVYEWGGTGGGESFELIGERAYEVIDARSDDKLLERMAREILRECDEILGGVKAKQWIDSVYHAARSRACSMLRLIGCDTPESTVKDTKTVPVNIVVQINGKPIPVAEWLKMIVDGLKR